mgnify:CR=1 FL=1
MDKPALVGIDIGTSKIRSSLYDIKGNLLFSESFTTPLVKKKKYVYNPVEEIYKKLLLLLSNTFKYSHKSNYFINGLSISSVGEAGVPIDINCNPLMDIIPWYDQRTESIRNKYLNNDNNNIYSYTGLNSDHFYSVYKILWIKENKPEIYNKIFKWLPVNDFFAMKLTNNISTDYSQAMRTLLFNPKKLKWSEKLIKYFKINKNILPDIINAGDIKGELNAPIKNLLKIKNKCIVAAGGHDHFVGIYGLGGFKKNIAINSMGSAEAIIVNTNKYISNKKLNNAKFISGVFKTKTKTNYYVVGSLLTSGIIIEWFIKIFKIKNYVKLNNMVNLKNNKNILFFPQFEYSHSPINSLKTKGFILGLDRSSSKSDVFTALLKGLTFDTKNALIFLKKILKIKIYKIICSGGSIQNKNWMKLRSQILKNDLQINENVENVSLGSAILAGLATKTYKNDYDAFKKINNKFKIIRFNKNNNRDEILFNKYITSIKNINKINKIL